MNSATSPVRISTSAKPNAAVASRARASISASAAAGGEIIPRHWNGEIGAKAQFIAAGIGGQIKALPDVLAREIKKRLGRLQDRRFGLNVAGLRERQ